MLCYALTCITALMFIFGRNYVHTISIQPISPFSGNFLSEVSDFDSIVEPETNQDPKSDVIKTRDSMESTECPDREKCLHEDSDTNTIKRELAEMGKLFVDKFFEDGNSGERLGREFKETEEKPYLEKEYEDEEGEGKPKHDDGNFTDPEVAEETSKVHNLTEVIKEEYDQIENPPLTADENDNVCEEEAEDASRGGKAEEKKGEMKAVVKSEGGAKAFIEETPRKNQMDVSDDFLEMHFYKYLPETGGAKLEPESDKLVTINLYPETPKREPAFHVPEKYDYIALLSDDKKFVEVPAVKFTVVSEDETKTERRKRNNYEPFSISRYRRRIPKRFRFKPIDNMFRVVNGDRLSYRNLKHIPILFVNAIPQKKIKFDNRLEKRSSNFDVSDNKYLREADMLIQSVNTSLQMDLGDFKKPTPVDGGVFVNPKYQNASLSQQDGSSVVENSEAEGGSDLDLWKSDLNPLKEGFIKSEISPLVIEPGLVDGIVTSSEASSVKENYESNDFNLLEQFSPFKEESLGKNDADSVQVPEVNGDSLVNSELNSVETAPFKEDVAKSEINSIEAGASKDESLVKDEIKGQTSSKPITLKDESLIKYEINPMEVATLKEQNVMKNEISPMEVAPLKKEDLVKNSIGSMDTASNEKDNFVSSMVADANNNLKKPLEYATNKNEAVDLVKNEVTDSESLVEDTESSNVADSKGLSENSMESINNKAVVDVKSNKNEGVNSGSAESAVNAQNGFAEGVVDANSNGLLKSVIGSKHKEISNANVADLLKSVEDLKNSDPKIKNLEDVQTLSPLSTTCAEDNFTINGASLAGPSVVPPPPGDSNFTEAVIPNNVSVQAVQTNSNVSQVEANLTVGGNFTGDMTAFNETNMYDDDADVGSILDLLGANTTSYATAQKEGTSVSSDAVGRMSVNASVSTNATDHVNASTSVYRDKGEKGGTTVSLSTANQVSTVSEKGGKEDTTVSSNATGHITMSAPSIPTISARTLNSSTPVVGTVVYVTTTPSGRSTKDHISMTPAGLSRNNTTPVVGMGTNVSTCATTPANGKSSFLTKLHNLQKDLKLVFEVQNILSGWKKEEKKSKRSKREIGHRHRRRSCKNRKNKEQQIKAAAVKAAKIREVQALGKILEWRAKSQGVDSKKCKRFLFKRRKKKKKKKKKKKRKKKKWWRKIFGNTGDKRHFLGKHFQNLH